jgi:hydroxyethylthiazole kinase
VDRDTHFGYDKTVAQSWQVHHFQGGFFLVPDIGRLTSVLEQVRLQQPVVHAITNTVTAGDVADVLRAIGARPIMAVAVEEVEEILSRADALVLNLGTPTPERVKAMVLAGHQANSLGKPVIFDPVGVTASRFRFDSAQRILTELRLAVIKGNRAEIGRLAGMEGELRGLDAIAGPTDLLAAASSLSLQRGAVIAVSGEQDLIVGDGQVLMVANGHPLMGRITGTGCMLAAAIAAFTAVEPDAMVATVAAVACFGLAGERAGHQGVGPGGFKSALIDSIHALTAEQMRTEARISAESRGAPSPLKNP